ncbi:unnamed protein product [Chrysoparadoxa australica]
MNNQARLRKPKEVLMAIHPFLPLHLPLLLWCDRSWRRHANHNDFWDRLCRSFWGLAPDNFRPAPDPVKRLYQIHHESFHSMLQGRSTASTVSHLYRPSIPAVSAATLMLQMMAN